MANIRPKRTYRTARERVAARRNTGGVSARRRRSGNCGMLLVGLTLIIFVFGGIGLLVLQRATQALGALEQADPRRVAAGGSSSGDALRSLPATLREPFNVLLIGVDQRESSDEGVRSDTLIVVHVNPAAGWAAMLSIPRDSVVTIPDVGQQKINTAYSYGYNNAAELYGHGTTPDAGGGALVAETVAGFLDLDIDYIAQVDFQGFEQIIDTLGGIPVDVPRPLLDAEFPTDNFGYERLYIPAGLQVFDGRTALSYARSRHGSSDFDRSQRQQQVLQALLHEVRRRGLFDQVALLPELAQDLEQTVTTTLPLSDLNVLRGLAGLAQTLTPERILRLSINPDDVGVVGEYGSDIYWNADDIALLVARLEAGPDQAAEVVRIQVQNGAEVQGMATRVTAALRNQGFLMLDATDAAATYERSLIIDYADNPQACRLLAAALGLDERAIQSPPGPDAPPAPYRTDIVVILGEDFEE